MSRRHRHRPPHRNDHLDALFASPLIHDIAADIGPVGRKRRRHPVALHLAFGAMARLWGSANRLDAETAHPQTWADIVERYNSGAENHPEGEVLHAVRVPLISDTYRHFRDRLTTDPYLDRFSEAFTHHAVATANSVGLLDPGGGGSRTYPDPTRTIYGDGTVVRPLYDPANNGRTDPDAEEHVGHDGPVWGNDLVIIATRGPQVHRRVILAVGRVHQKSREADTAVALIRQVHAEAGDGIQAVVYDGAFRGVHHETIMSELGLIVVNKVHPASRKKEKRTYQQVPLGQWAHTVLKNECVHTLVAHAGAVHDSTLDDSGKLVLSEPLRRQQIRRYTRGRDGGYRFTLGVIVPCPKESFTAWISPHPQPGDTGNRRPDQLRLIHENDDYFQTLYGLRNDSESINAHYKETLNDNRASALGWRRQVVDLTSWALLTNTLAWHQHRICQAERNKAA
ncbi:MAG: hypothetical protein WC184_04350 [Acidimicrobiia bacterium]